MIFVSKYGERFVNEASRSYDVPAKAMYNYDPVKLDFANLVCWCIFDEKARVKGPAGLPVPIGKPVYTWSADNSAEIAKGWIIKADSMSEMAGKIGVDQAVLEKTVANYNRYCVEKKDPDFGREMGLIPLDTAPSMPLRATPVFGEPRGDLESMSRQRFSILKASRSVVLFAAGNASGFPFPRHVSFKRHSDR